MTAAPYGTTRDRAGSTGRQTGTVIALASEHGREAPHTRPAEAVAASLSAEPARGGPVRFAGVEGVRGLAAASIVVYHCWRYATEGSVGGTVADAALRHLSAGVLLFFSLSGLLLYRPYAAAILDARPWPDVRSYGRNRFLRIMPTYWVILVVVAIGLGAALVPRSPELITIGRLTAPADLAANLALVQGYHPSTFLSGIGPAWTLIIEVAFYVALPIVSVAAFALSRRVSHRWRPLVAMVPPAALLGLGFAGKLAASAVLDGGDGWGRNWGAVLARSFLANADLFSFGMAVAVVAVLHADGRISLPRGWRPAAVVGAAMLLALATAIPHGALGNFRYDVLAAAASALVIAAIVLDPARGGRRVRSLLESRPMVAVGLASYSLYLWHEPLIHWLDDRGVIGGTGLGALLAAVVVVGAIAGVLSALTYRFVEKPALERRGSRATGIRAGHA